MAFGDFLAGTGYLETGGLASKTTEALGVAPIAKDLLVATARFGASVSCTPRSGWVEWASLQTTDPAKNLWGFYRRCDGTEGTGAQIFADANLGGNATVVWHLIRGPFASSPVDLNAEVQNEVEASVQVSSITSTLAIAQAEEVVYYASSSSSSRTITTGDADYQNPLHGNGGRLFGEYRVTSGVETPEHDWSWTTFRDNTHCLGSFKRETTPGDRAQHRAFNHASRVAAQHASRW